MIKRFLAFAMCAMSLSAFAQHEFADTLSLKANQPLSPSLSTLGDSLGRAETLYHYGEKFEQYQDSVHSHTSLTPIIYYPGLYPGQITMMQWSGGAAIVAGQRESMPGLLGRESAVLNFYQNVDKFTFTAFGVANKIGYYHGLSTQWGFGGSVSYALNDNLSFTAFGSYYTQPHVNQPALLGYVGYPTVGGYANYRFGSSNFGVKVGAQGYYSLSSRHWEAQPIVMPYFRLAKGADIGIDVGGILYQVLRNTSVFNSNNDFRPTTGPIRSDGRPVKR